MVKTLKQYLTELGFSKEQYSIVMKRTYLELHLDSINAVNYILSDDNEFNLDFIQHTEKPLLIVTWKNE